MACPIPSCRVATCCSSRSPRRRLAARHPSSGRRHVRDGFLGLSGLPRRYPEGAAGHPSTSAWTAISCCTPPLMWLDKAETWALAESLGGEGLVEIVREHTHLLRKPARPASRVGPWLRRVPVCALRKRGFVTWQAGTTVGWLAAAGETLGVLEQASSTWAGRAAHSVAAGRWCRSGNTRRAGRPRRSAQPAGREEQRRNRVPEGNWASPARWWCAGPCCRRGPGNPRLQARNDSGLGQRGGVRRSPATHNPGRFHWSERASAMSDDLRLVDRLGETGHPAEHRPSAFRRPAAPNRGREAQCGGRTGPPTNLHAQLMTQSATTRARPEPLNVRIPAAATAAAGGRP